MTINGKIQREQIIAHIKEVLKDRTPHRLEHETADHAHHLYSLLCFGHHNELQHSLDSADIAGEFWDKIEHLSPRINDHFSSADLGEWDELPRNIVKECDLLPGDFIVIKQAQSTLWEWQHAGMIKDENTLYTAMYPDHVLEQPITYFRTYATQFRAFQIRANHAQPEWGINACEIAHKRIGNVYGISDKWYALHHKKAPMYCSLIPWFAWILATGLNLDAHCSDHTDIENRKKRLQHLCRIPHTIVYPTNLAESHIDYPEHGYAAKTDCVLDLIRHTAT